MTILLKEFGWPEIDLGGIENARWLEALSLAWVVTPTAPARPPRLQAGREVIMNTVVYIRR